MKYLQHYFSIFLISLFLFFLIEARAQADVLYIGDTTYNNVFNAVRKKSSDLAVDVDSYTKLTLRSAAIYNYEQWLYAVGPAMSGKVIDAVVISLGKKDLKLNSGSFPDNASLDQGIRAILSGLGTTAPIFWILPHENMAKSAIQLDQLHKVNDAIMRATAAVGTTYTLYPVSLDDWAIHYELDIKTLLNRNRLAFNRDAAKVVAGLIIDYSNAEFDKGTLVLASDP